jgi:MipA family protein
MTMAATLRQPLRLTRGMAMGHAVRAALHGALALGLASAATAQDIPSGDSPRAVIEVLGGVSISPSYFGSDDYDAGPILRPRFDYVRLPGGLEFGSVDAPGDQQGFGVRTSARYIGSRRPDDDPSLAGTDRIDSSIELGLGIGYNAEDWRAYGVVRYGVIGHNAWVGEAGADALFSPTDSLLINVGPRANWGSSRFMDTYFGISADEAAAAPQLDEFSPQSGLYSVGMEVGARYAFSPRWGVEGAATYDRLVDDAADSPVTQAGSRDQFGVRFGISRTIRLGF